MPRWEPFWPSFLTHFQNIRTQGSLFLSDDPGYYFLTQIYVFQPFCAETNRRFCVQTISPGKFSKPSPPPLRERPNCNTIPRHGSRASRLVTLAVFCSSQGNNSIANKKLSFVVMALNIHNCFQRRCYGRDIGCNTNINATISHSNTYPASCSPS